MRKYYIGKSKINGKGIILSKDVAQDEIIFRFVGQKISNKMSWRRGPNCLQIGYSEWLSPDPNSAGRYLNHSCNPNAGIRGRRTIVAMKPIKAGEEVVIDYALNEIHPLWHMKCNCQSKNCRKVVKPYQDLPVQRQKKYIKYTSKHIKDLKMHLNWNEYLGMKKNLKVSSA